MSIVRTSCNEDEDRVESTKTRATLSSSLVRRPITQCYFDGPRIYRFFKEAWQAKALLKGEVWISTLNECRGYEERARGDRHEGTLIRTRYGSDTGYGWVDNMEYFEDHIVADDAVVPVVVQKEYLYHVVRETVMEKAADSNSAALDGDLIEWLPDGFVICTSATITLNNALCFGYHCVEILRPTEFFHRVTTELARERRIREAIMKAITYNVRRYTAGNPPGLIGFVKPKNGIYENQHEIRLLWTSFNKIQPLEPFLLTVPDIVPICRLVLVPWSASLLETQNLSRFCFSKSSLGLRATIDVMKYLKMVDRIPFAPSDDQK